LTSEGGKPTGRGRGSDSQEAGNQQEGTQQHKLAASPVVEALVPDPAQPPSDAMVIQGLLGRSDKEGYWRIYYSSDLKTYAEFRAEDALYSEPIPKEESALGLEVTRVWLKQEAEMMYPTYIPVQAGIPQPHPWGRPWMTSAGLPGEVQNTWDLLGRPQPARVMLAGSPRYPVYPPYLPVDPVWLAGMPSGPIIGPTGPIWPF
jgi:hypothetical protein